MEPLSIDRRKLFEQVASHIERQILNGALRPGDRLPAERDLQTRFGVGRPAIREALIALQRAGLVEISNGAPARVAMPTASGVLAAAVPAVRQMLSSKDGQRHFQGVRLFLEAGLARDAARTADEEDLRRLREALEANRRAIGNMPDFVRTDIAFHFVLAEITRNPIFLALHDAMSEWLTSQRVVTLEAAGQDKIAFKAHERIFRAIRRHDADGAEAAMREHIQQLSGAFWDQYSEGGPDSPDEVQR